MKYYFKILSNLTFLGAVIQISNSKGCEYSHNTRVYRPQLTVYAKLQRHVYVNKFNWSTLRHDRQTARCLRQNQCQIRTTICGMNSARYGRK